MAKKTMIRAIAYVTDDDQFKFTVSEWPFPEDETKVGYEIQTEFDGSDRGSLFFERATDLAMFADCLAEYKTDLLTPKLNKENDE